MIRGINVSNPVDLNKEYLSYTADYAIRHGINHVQINGPIHNPVKGNIDGMVFYRKYAQFNGEKDEAYVRYSMEAAADMTEKLSANGIKCYMWHHELELPLGFDAAYPEILNSDGDVEVTHPLVRDFLENKIYDFFAAYPKMDGIVLTLHETRIPLLKLKNQKLSPTERVKYITEILYRACNECGKELIVRPFASMPEDYEMMTKAYEEISSELVIMDKWTQFDWSLTLPHNKFFGKIKHNPLLVEADIFGEFFGKGHLPLMLKEHIKEKVAYCMDFSPVGFVSRIDREGYNCFGSANEVNLEIMMASLDGRNIDEAIDEFFSHRYGEAGWAARALMEGTEDIQKKIFYANGYYYTELSRFPRLNHSKNHFYIEMMKKDYSIASKEWFIPDGWTRESTEALLEEKRSARLLTEEKLKALAALEGRLAEEDYEALSIQFKNLGYVARLWEVLTEAFIAYAGYFDTRNEAHANALDKALRRLAEIDAEASAELGEKYYLTALGQHHFDGAASGTVEAFIEETRASFDAERRITSYLEGEDLTDFVICGGGNEGHRLMKEVNFSYTFVNEHGICRTPGKASGKAFSGVNAHGWFSYEIAVKPMAENTIVIKAGGDEGHIDFSVDVNGDRTVIHGSADAPAEFTVRYTESSGECRARIRIDRLSEYTPFIYTIKVK